MSFPTISSIKSCNAAEHEQGSVQGALYGARAFASGTLWRDVHTLPWGVPVLVVPGIYAVVRGKGPPLLTPPAAQCLSLAHPPTPPCTGTGPLVFAFLFSAFTQTGSPLPYFPGRHRPGLGRGGQISTRQ